MSSGGAGAAATANGPSSTEEHALEQPWQLYLHYPTFTQSIENYASEAYQVQNKGETGGAV